MRASVRSRIAAWNCLRRALGLAELGVRMIWIPQDRNAEHPRRRVSEQLNCLSRQLVVHVGDAGNIPARTRKARHKPACDRVVAHDYDDRDRSGCLLDNRCLLAAERIDHVWAELDQLSRQLRKSLVLALCVAVFDGHGLSIDVTKCLQLVKAWLDDFTILLSKKQYSHPLHPLALLRARR